MSNNLAMTGPLFTDMVTGRANGRRRSHMDCLGNTYKILPSGREKRGGRRTKGSK